jgi:hypothetical protein
VRGYSNPPAEFGVCHLAVAGTAWLFARDDMVNKLDYLFVDEAGQVSLANLAGMSRCARNVILMGDQMQATNQLLNWFGDIRFCRNIRIEAKSSVHNKPFFMPENA